MKPTMRREAFTAASAFRRPIVTITGSGPDSLDSGNAHDLVRLKAQAPSGIGEAVLNGCLEGFHPIRAIHWLQEEVVETEVEEVLRLSLRFHLWENQLQFVAALYNQS